MKNGKGKYTFKDGGIYDGEWKDGKYDGKGKYTFKSISKPILDILNQYKLD